MKLILVIGSNRRVLVTRDQFSIGSQRDNNFVISDPTVSRHHALIVRHGQNFELHDLNSANGTFANGACVARPVILHDQDSIRFGSVRTQVFVFAEASFWRRKLPTAVRWAVLLVVMASTGAFVIRAAKDWYHAEKDIDNVPKSEDGGAIPVTPTPGTDPCLGVLSPDYSSKFQTSVQNYVKQGHSEDEARVLTCGDVTRQACVELSIPSIMLAEKEALAKMPPLGPGLGPLTPAEKRLQERDEEKAKGEMKNKQDSLEACQQTLGCERASCDELSN